MKSSNYFSLLVILAVMTLFAAAGCKDAGKLSGIVSFRGKPCDPTVSGNTVPPCSGPYSAYKVEVRKKGDTEKVVSTTVTDDKGQFVMPLLPGEYIIFTQNGPSEDNVKENAFTIKAGEATNIELSVSTGIM